MEIPEWLEKVGLMGSGGAIATLAAFLKYLRDRNKDTIEERDTMTQGLLKEIERLRGHRDNCEDEIQTVHQQYQEKMQRIIDSSMELLEKFDEQVRINFENRRTIHELRNQLTMFNDSVKTDGTGKRLYDFPQGIVKEKTPNSEKK